MSLELVGLLIGVFLGLLHIVLASHAASWQRGYRWTAGPRDEPVAPLIGGAGRLARASANYLETFPFFASLVLAVLVQDRHSDLSVSGVALYLAGRLAYLPLYAFGVYLIRSIAWNVATVGIVLLGVAILV